MLCHLYTSILLASDVGLPTNIFRCTAKGNLKVCLIKDFGELIHSGERVWIDVRQVGG